MKPLSEIVKLNQTRYGTDFNGEKAIEKLHEEIVEELIPATQVKDADKVIDALSKIIGKTVSTLALLGYNPELVMKQYVKSIANTEYTPDFRTCKTQEKVS